MGIEGGREEKRGEREESLVKRRRGAKTTGGSDLKSPVVSFAGRDNNHRQASNTRQWCLLCFGRSVFESKALRRIWGGRKAVMSIVLLLTTTTTTCILKILSPRGSTNSGLATMYVCISLDKQRKVFVMTSFLQPTDLPLYWKLRLVN